MAAAGAGDAGGGSEPERAGTSITALTRERSVRIFWLFSSKKG
jgi:hypothetical protein